MAKMKMEEHRIEPRTSSLSFYSAHLANYAFAFYNDNNTWKIRVAQTVPMFFLKRPDYNSKFTQTERD